MEIAQACKLAPGTTHRLLQAMIEEGVVEQNLGTGRYRLGIGLLHLGRRLVDRLEVRREALPLMEQLRNQTGECVYLNINDRDERVCIESLDSLHDLRVISPTGQRSPLHAGASAKCLLAFLTSEELEVYFRRMDLNRVTVRTVVDEALLLSELEQIRRQGYAISHGERLDGLWAIAGPVRDSGGGVIASLAVTFPEVRYTPQRAREMVTHLLRASAALSARMGFEDDVSGGRC